MTISKSRILVGFFFISLGAVHAQTVETILEKYYSAIGGKENIGRVTSSVVTAVEYQSLNIFIAGQRHFVTSKEIKSLYPFFRIEHKESVGSTSPQKESLRINNERGSYSITLKPNAYSTKGDPGKRCTVHPALDLKLRYEKGELSVGKDSTLFNKKCRAIQSGEGKTRQVFYFQKSDGLLIARIDLLNRQLTTFADYRKIQGVAYPFKEERFSSEMNYRSSVEVQQVEFNVQLTPGDFDVDESTLPGLRDEKMLRSKIEYLPAESKDLSFSELMHKQFAGRRVLVYPWSTTCEPCKNEFLNYDGFFYSFLWDLRIALVFLNVDEPSRETQWHEDVKRYNLIGSNLSAAPGSVLYSDFDSQYHKGRQVDSARYILLDEQGTALSSKIKTVGHADFKIQLRKLLEQQ